MELFLIYLWLKLDTFVGWSIAICIVSVGLLMLTFLIWGMENNEFFPKWKRFLWVIIPSFCFSIFTPSSKDTAILVGASYAIDLAKSPEGQKIQTLIRKKANEYLDEQLKEEVKK